MVNLSLGVAFALMARDRVRVDGPFASPAFALVLIFAGIIAVPAALYLYWAHAAWSWLYLVDPAEIVELAVVPVLVFQCGALLGGWFLGSRLLRADKLRAAVLTIVGALAAVLVLTALLRHRLGVSGSYDDFHRGASPGLLEVKLGYVLIAVALGGAIGAGFVAVELVRDSRRVRGR